MRDSASATTATPARSCVARRPAASRRAPLSAWNIANGIVFYHLVALLALVPWCFSLTGALSAVLGIYLFGVLGINIGYHRLLTHKGFGCPKWLEHTLVVLGVCCLQGSPIRWVAIHRRHHQHADEPGDPHSPRVNFFWGHVGWVMTRIEGPDLLALYDRYSKDLTRDKFYVWIDRGWWLKIVLLSWAVFFFAGFFAQLLLGGTIGQAILFGLSLLVWGVFVRTVVHWHLTWAVNSVSHRWGYRNYDTPDNSRNNIILGVLANGEGWHNNHHADPRSARHGHKFWELDVAWLTIRLLMWMGLATNVATPSSQPASLVGTRHRAPASAG
jgi:fatty-acid desaturase